MCRALFVRIYDWELINENHRWYSKRYILRSIIMVAVNVIYWLVYLLLCIPYGLMSLSRVSTAVDRCR